MKHTLLLALVVTLVGSLALGAGDKHISKEVLASFSREFVQAKNVTWDVRHDLAVAQFTMDNQVLLAYFRNDGELVALTRNISSDQLPIHLIMSLKNDYAEWSMIESIEMYAQDQTSYFVTIARKDHKMILRSADSENWERFLGNESR